MSLIIDNLNTELVLKKLKEVSDDQTYNSFYKSAKVAPSSNNDKLAVSKATYGLIPLFTNAVYLCIIYGCPPC